MEISVERKPLELGGRLPRCLVVFKGEGGVEIARISLYWMQGKLYAKFKGTREAAERLVSILRDLGGAAEAKQYGGSWYVVLTTNAIAAIGHGGWRDAVRGFVEDLHSAGVIDEQRRDALLEKLAAAESKIPLAGVYFNVNYDKSRGALAAVYKPKSEKRFKKAVELLKRYGLAEGLHFTGGRTPGGRYYIRLTYDGIREVARRASAGDIAAKILVERFKKEASALGAGEAAERLINSAPGARRLPLMVEGGGAVVKALSAELSEGCRGLDCRLKITVEYEAGGRTNRLSIVYRWEKSGGGYAARAEVRLGDSVKAAVLKALVGEYAVSAVKAKLFMRHLEKLSEFAELAEAVGKWLRTKAE
nr:PaRep2b protein [Pyrobaculum sp.]